MLTFYRPRLVRPRFPCCFGLSSDSKEFPIVNDKQVTPSSPVFSDRPYQAMSADLHLAGISQWTVHG